MESKDSGVWTKGEPVTLQKNCLFLRKGTTLELSPGNLLIPLDEPSKRAVKVTDAGRVYAWTFLLPDGSITEFFLHTNSYIHVKKNLNKKIAEHMKQYFAKPKKK